VGLAGDGGGVSDAVLTEAADGVLLITLNRPEARNAVNAAVAEGVAAALDRLDGDDSLRVAILTGAGSSFCAGMDLKAFVAGERPYVAGRGFAGIAQGRPDKPIIAAIEGYAVAGGFEVALACDLIVAARDARVGIPEVKRGLVAAAGALIRLPKRIPYHLAMELALTGDPIGAARAQELGIVNRLAEPGEAVAVARELAAAIVANGPLATAASKRIVAAAPDWTEEEAWQRQGEIAGPVMASEDAREGATAFAEKRPPVWRGR
jgi:enoyl-CoA hydratase